MRTLSNQQVIVWDHLISRGFDEKIIKEVVPICVDDTRHRLYPLFTAIRQNSPDLVELHAHSIRDAAANIGALNFSDAAAALEAAAENHNLSEAIKLYDRVEFELERLALFVSDPNWYDRLKPA